MVLPAWSFWRKSPSWTVLPDLILGRGCGRKVDPYLPEPGEREWVRLNRMTDTLWKHYLPSYYVLRAWSVISLISVRLLKGKNWIVSVDFRHRQGVGYLLQNVRCDDSRGWESHAHGVSTSFYCWCYNLMRPSSTKHWHWTVFDESSFRTNVQEGLKVSKNEFYKFIYFQSVL